jgi:polyhydroxyalkanoate synthase
MKIRRDVDRHALRVRNGLQYATGGSFVDVGATPHHTVWSRHTIELWRYESERRSASPPVLLVPSLVNRSYIFDLHPGNSFVERLLEAELDVFLLDWGSPQEADAHNTLETYIDQCLPAAISAVTAETGSEEASVVGYCMGGILALLYAAGYRSAGVRNLVCLGTPVDFDAMGLLVAMVREGRLEIGEILDEAGNVPGEVVRRLIQLRRPTGTLVTYANLWENLWSDAYVGGYQAMARWVRDAVPLPGALAEQITALLVRDNALMSGRVTLGGRELELSSIDVPFLSVIAEHDDIVPLAAASPLAGLVGGPNAEDLRLPSGHIALVAGRRAATTTIPHIIDWIRRTSERVQTEPEL